MPQAFTSATELLRFFWKVATAIQIDGCSDCDDAGEKAGDAERVY